MSMDEIERIFDNALDEMGKAYPKSPTIVMGATRIMDHPESENWTYPVVAGARGLESLAEDPLELAEMVLSMIRSLKKVCLSIAGEEDGKAMFDLVCTKALGMSDDEDDETTIEKRERGVGGKPENIQIEDLTKDWRGFIE